MQGGTLEATQVPLLRDIDQQIIGVLRTSARISAHDLARTIGADYRTVRRELAHLLDSGTVRVSVLADPSLTGHRLVAFVWLRSQAVQNPLVEHLAAASDVRWAAVMIDRTRAVAQVSCESAADLLRLLDELRLWPEVTDVDAALVMRSYIGPQVASTSPELRGGATEAGTLWLGGEISDALDETDRKILALLRVDGRMSLTAIADATDIPLTTARRRLTRLLDSDGVRLQCRVNPAALGYTLHAGVRVRVRRDATGLARQLANLHAVAWLSELTGSHALMAELMTSTQQEMDEAIHAITDDPRSRDVLIDYYDPGSVKDTGLW